MLSIRFHERSSDAYRCQDGFERSHARIYAGLNSDSWTLSTTANACHSDVRTVGLGRNNSCN
jgi:hypothetical protein